MDELEHTAGDQHEYLWALDTDYSALRSDQQSYNTVIAGLFSLAVLIFGPLGYWLTSSCDFTTLSCPKYPPELLAVVPLGPLGIIGFYSVLSNINLMRSYYTRLVESEMQRVANSPAIAFRGGAPLRLPGFANLTETLVSQRRGVLHYRLLNLLTVAGLGVLFTGTTVLCVLFTRPVDLQVLAAVFYAFAITLLVLTVRDDTRGGLAMWRFATRLGTAPAQDAAPRRAGRPLLSYLVLPRPGDLLYKGTIIPVAWLLSAAAGGRLTPGGFGLVAGFTAVFEILFYQARYIVNDLRGLGADPEYSSFKRRNRFPAWAGRREIRMALADVALRGAAALWIAIRVFPDPYRVVLLAAMAAVVLQAAVYETLRTRVSPRAGRDLLALTGGRALILVLVGVGYGIRAGLGLLLGHAAAPDWTLVGVGAAMMTAFGAMFVTMTWAIDGVSQIVLEPGEALPAWRYAPGLALDAQIAPLLRMAGLLRRRDGALEPARHAHGAEEAAWLDRLRPLRGVSSPSWWNLMFLLACPLAALTGIRLAGVAGVTRPLWAAGVGLAVAAAVLALHRGGVLAPRLPSAAAAVLPALAVAAGCAALGLLIAPRTMPAGVLAAAPLALVGSVYLGFRNASRNFVLFDPAIVLAAVRRDLSALSARLTVAVIGDEAARRILHPAPAETPGAGASAGEVKVRVTIRGRPARRR